MIDSPNTSINTETQPANEDSEQGSRPRVSSKGKRLLAFMLDFILALLLVNTFNQLFKEEHWDLVLQAHHWEQVMYFYGSIFGFLLIRDIGGNSPGYFLLGMSLHNLKDLTRHPESSKRIMRNLVLLLLPIEGIILLRDPYARRLADRWCGTIVLDHPKPLRIPLRLLFGNMIFFGFFGAAIFLQKSVLEKTAAYQIAEKAIRNHPELELVLSRFPELEETEMSLDLRDQSTLSMIQSQLGRGEKRIRVTVYVERVEKPNGWKVVEIRLETGNEEN